MADPLIERLRPSELLDVLIARRAQVQRAHGVSVLVLVFTGLAVLTAVWGAARYVGDLGGVFFTVGIMVLFGAVSIGLSMTRTARTEAGKARFAEDLVRTLLDDFHPAGRIGVALVLGGHDRVAARYWTGKSLHGNAKYKYADRWLTLKFLLADGTRVRLVRKADVKTKKGTVQRHKRQLYVHLTPNPARYGTGPWDTSVLDGLVKTAVARKFHDPPEELRVRTKGHAATIDLKVTQLDADILPDEVVALLDATVSAVHLHQLDPKS